MNCNLPKITYPTLRILLLVKLYEVIYLQTDVGVKKVSIDTIQNSYDSSKVKLLLESLSLKRVENKALEVVYQTSIALRLSSVLRRNALEVAYQILDEFHQKKVNFCQEDMSTAEGVLSDCTGTVFSPGLLQFRLGDRGLSIWLQHLMQPMPRSRLNKPLPFSINSLQSERGLFSCQYSHARCCSLLRLAHGAGITLNRLDDSLDNPWMILAPDPIPWLTNQETLLMTHLAERKLISQIVTIADDLSDLVTNPQSCLASAISLSQSFQDFYQRCQIFGEPSISGLRLSQGRLGLLMITQRLLRQLIEIGLNEPAPSEL